MEIKRAEFLALLESVSPGLSDKEETEQSDCFAFGDGEVMTFNEEVACRRKCEYELSGAVRAKPLLDFLRRVSSDEVTAERKGDEFRIRCKGEKAGVTMQKDVEMRIGDIDSPGKFKKLPKEFAEAVGIVRLAANKTQDGSVLCSIHVHPEFLEACDNFGIVRYPIQIPIDDSVCISAKGLTKVIDVGVKGINVTEGWVHFKGPEKMVMSCRRVIDPYPDLDEILSMSGDQMHLPKGLDEAISKAAVFAEQSLLVQIEKKGLRLRGEGPNGWYERTAKMKHEGEPLNFLIAPRLLSEIVRRFSSCEVSKGKLKADNGTFQFLAVTGVEEK